MVPVPVYWHLTTQESRDNPTCEGGQQREGSNMFTEIKVNMMVRLKLPWLPPSEVIWWPRISWATERMHCGLRPSSYLSLECKKVIWQLEHFLNSRWWAVEGWILNRARAAGLHSYPHSTSMSLTRWEQVHLGRKGESIPLMSVV